MGELSYILVKGLSRRRLLPLLFVTYPQQFSRNRKLLLLKSSERVESLLESQVLPDIYGLQEKKKKSQADNKRN